MHNIARPNQAVSKQEVLYVIRLYTHSNSLLSRKSNFLEAALMSNT